MRPGTTCNTRDLGEIVGADPRTRGHRLHCPRPSPCGQVSHQVHIHRKSVITPDGGSRGQDTGEGDQGSGNSEMNVTAEPDGGTVDSHPWNCLPLGQRMFIGHMCTAGHCRMPGGAQAAPDAHLQRPGPCGSAGHPSSPHHTVTCVSAGLKQWKELLVLVTDLKWEVLSFGAHTLPTHNAPWAIFGDSMLE